MKRFWTAEKIFDGCSITLDSEESKHARKVLRLEEGAKILLSNGSGIEAEAEITSLQKDTLVVFVKKILRIEKERFPRIEIIQSLLKGPRMDWFVEKATELGVNSIHPVNSKYSVAGSKEDRWQRIAHSAIKQSGNTRLPDISSTQELFELCAKLPEKSLKILLRPGAEKSLASILQEQNDKSPIYLALGPEGGFSEEEEQELEALGFLPAALAKNILRGETAGIAALSIALHIIDF